MNGDINIGKVIGTVSLLVGIAALAVAVGLRNARNRKSTSASGPSALIGGILAWSTAFLYPALAVFIFVFATIVWHMITSKSWDNALEAVMWLGGILWQLDVIKNVRRARAEAAKTSATGNKSNET